MELLLSNPVTTVIVAVVCILVGKYVWVSKDDEKKINKDITKTKEDFLAELHDLEIAFTEKIGSQSEKMRIIQKDILDEADKKFFTKEMAERHSERISALEQILHEILPRLEKIDVLYDMYKNKQM